MSRFKIKFAREGGFGFFESFALDGYKHMAEEEAEAIAVSGVLGFDEEDAPKILLEGIALLQSTNPTQWNKILPDSLLANMLLADAVLKGKPGKLTIQI
jgi:hypothetical protein